MTTKGKAIAISREFPGDQVLQQIHLARKALQEKAKQRGLSLGAYVRSLNMDTMKTSADNRE